jgi:hypothetical protein
VFTHSIGNGGDKVLGFVFTVCDITTGDGDGSGAIDGQVRYDEVVLIAAGGAFPPFKRKPNILVRM